MKIHELLSDESKWTKGALARDKDGIGVGENSPEAVSYCIGGAAIKCYGQNEYFKVIDKICNKLRIHGGLANWNNAPERKFEEVRTVCLELDV